MLRMLRKMSTYATCVATTQLCFAAQRYAPKGAPGFLGKLHLLFVWLATVWLATLPEIKDKYFLVKLSKITTNHFW